LRLLKVTSRIAPWGRFLFLPHVGYSQIPLRDSIILLMASFLIAACLIAPAQAMTQHPIVLSSNSKVATAGFFQLRWEPPRDNANWYLQESQDASLQNFKVIYSGPDLARVISGKSDGIYYYRVVANNNPVQQMSNIVKVTVAHHALSNAFAFFTVGAFIFLAILVSIIIGNRKNIKS